MSEHPSIAVTELGSDGPPLVLLHGLAGSSREMVPTARALSENFRVLLVDQRGHGSSTRRSADLSRKAFVADVVHVLERYAPGERSILVGQSMGAHTAFLTAAERPDLVESLVMLEGHVGGSDDPRDAVRLGEFFASWPVPFVDEAHARAFLGSDAIVDAWIADLESTDDGLRPRFDPDIMQRTIEGVHKPRWDEWEALQVPTLAIFAKHGMFSAPDRQALIHRRPSTERIDLSAGSHDAHLDAFEEWIEVLRGWIRAGDGVG
ncbi:alpha/beta hydrolase [Microbacterium sp. M28]|uniref:alpha/beta fold hydrolase n=1 Tax=Microbacterium sp. M28 TaxID=2962064 RepID=UPI0021F48864|nr:alpha/beta hydrolase [Microbacterium sp. M28]UYO98055.1 alpha/beta hydrolase [Microbacterium sp. M28]